MIDKKTIFKSFIIISLIVIIIFAFIQIRNTLARYETTTTTEREVDVAFWMVDTSFASERLLIDEIYPSNTPYEYTFTVSNYEGTKRAETDLEYDIVLTATTNLPFEYEIQKGGITCGKTEQLQTDEDGTFYKKMIIDPPASDDFKLENETNDIDTFVIKVTFPKSNSNNENYADLMEDIVLDISATQIIGE